MTTSIFGSVVHRVEDPRFLTGGARYVDALRPEGALRATFVRSIIAHGRLSGIEVSEASSMPGVVAVLTAADLQLKPRPPAGNVEGPFERPVPASEVVRYVGEPVAIVIAESSAQAQDAAEAVIVEVEPLDPVIGVDAALADGAPLLFPDAGTNVAHRVRGVLGRRRDRGRRGGRSRADRPSTPRALADGDERDRGRAHR